MDACLQDLTPNVFAQDLTPNVFGPGALRSLIAQHPLERRVRLLTCIQFDHGPFNSLY